jgi:hypothetical protein
MAASPRLPFAYEDRSRFAALDGVPLGDALAGIRRVSVVVRPPGQHLKFELDSAAGAQGIERIRQALGTTGTLSYRPPSDDGRDVPLLGGIVHTALWFEFETGLHWGLALALTTGDSAPGHGTQVLWCTRDSSPGLVVLGMLKGGGWSGDSPEEINRRLASVIAEEQSQQTARYASAAEDEGRRLDGLELATIFSLPRQGIACVRMKGGETVEEFRFQECHSTDPRHAARLQRAFGPDCRLNYLPVAERAHRFQNFLRGVFHAELITLGPFEYRLELHGRPTTPPYTDSTVEPLFSLAIRPRGSVQFITVGYVSGPSGMYMYQRREGGSSHLPSQAVAKLRPTSLPDFFELLDVEMLPWREIHGSALDSRYWVEPDDTERPN